MQMASTHTLNCTCFHMPPEYLSEADSTDLCSSTPCLAFPANQPLAQLVTTEHVQQVLDILKSLSPKQEPHPPPAAENRVEPEKPKARASTLEFKEVNEVWDRKEYKYKLVESMILPNEVNELNHYVFKISLYKEKPSECRESPSAALDPSTLEHLNLLLDFIRTAYASTMERLDLLLEKYEITAGQLRCVRNDFKEEKKTKDEVEYFYVKAQYLDFNGKIFRETLSKYTIKKFHKAKQITDLEVATFSEHSWKFLSMIESHLYDRVVINAAYFREENPTYTRPSIKESNRGRQTSWIIIGLDEIDEEEPSPAKGDGIDLLEVKGDDLLICSPTVPGFSLGNSRWALSEAHVKRVSTNAFDDVVKGKGQGFSVLLHGPPGVGKTLTAELLAEHLQKPLMQVSTSELGTTVEAVEQRLPRIFKRTAQWQAILLLDEADVLLEQRSVQDIHRNALVCVIHFKLKYGKLNLEQRTKGDPIYSQDAFDDWVRKERNSREIKNLVSTAHALAIEEECQVSMSHLDVAIAACEDFEYDFKGVGQIEHLHAYN
ncbi:hypothetical protein V8E51_009549 [Hyaloscypha variabilis]